MNWFCIFMTVALLLVNSKIGYTDAADQHTQHLGECTDDSQCFSKFPNTYCDFEEKFLCNVGVCRCFTSHIPAALNPDKPEEITCLLKAENYGDKCQHDLQCTSAFGNLSSCTYTAENGYTCGCNPNSVFCDSIGHYPKQCHPIRNLNEQCSECDNQCNHTENAVCSSSHSYDQPFRCRCDQYHIQIPGRSDCIPKATNEGHNCDISPEQCSQFANSICDEDTKTCICDSTTHVSSGTSCLPKREQFNMKCKSGIQCLTENSRCFNNVCQCQQTYVPSVKFPTTCLRASLNRGDACVEDVQCTGKMGSSSECDPGNLTCQCQHGFIYASYIHPEYGNCYPVTRLGGVCRYSEQCLDANGSTSNTRCFINSTGTGIDLCDCVDRNRFVEHDGICYERKTTGQSCDKDVECKLFITGPVFCDHATRSCECDDNYAASSNRSSCILSDDWTRSMICISMK